MIAGCRFYGSLDGNDGKYVKKIDGIIFDFIDNIFGGLYRNSICHSDIGQFTFANLLSTILNSYPENTVTNTFISTENYTIPNDR